MERSDKVASLSHAFAFGSSAATKLLKPQERGLLVRFYHEFADHRHDDPTGLQALKKVLGTDDLVKFQKEWEEFVVGLRFP